MVIFETVQYNEEMFEISGYLEKDNTEADTGVYFEATEIIWLMNAEENKAVAVNVTPIMSAEQIEEIENLILINIQNNE